MPVNWISDVNYKMEIVKAIWIWFMTFRFQSLLPGSVCCILRWNEWNHAYTFSGFRFFEHFEKQLLRRNHESVMATRLSTKWYFYLGIRRTIGYTLLNTHFFLDTNNEYNVFWYIIFLKKIPRFGKHVRYTFYMIENFILLDIFTVTLQLRLVQRKLLLLSLFNLNSLNLKLSIITHFFTMIVFTW